MSRSMHSSTEYFGSPSEYPMNSREYLPLTSEIGKRSRNTRSSDTSWRSPSTSSGTSRDSKAFVWMSRRWGMSMPSCNGENEITGSVSGISTSRANGHGSAATPAAGLEDDRELGLFLDHG